MSDDTLMRLLPTKEAAFAFIEELDAENAKLRTDLAAMRELLREAREYLVLADADGLALLVRIDAALKEEK